MRTILEKTANLYPEKTALAFGEETVTFRELWERTIRLAQVLRQAGIQKGDKVAIYLPNCPEYAYSYLAVFCLGAVGVPLDFMLKKDELSSCLAHSEAKLLIAQERKGLDYEDLKKESAGLETVFLSKDLPQAIAEAPKELEEVVLTDEDPALIMYTSGTTGRPKGIVLTYKHLEGSPAAMKHFVDLSEKDIKLAAIPLSHIGGFIYLQNCVHFGITLVLMARFNPFEFLELVQKYGVTCFHIVPPMYNAILTLKEIERFDLSFLRWVVVFGAPSSPEILERFHKYCPNAQLLNGWGMTETCPPNTVTPMGSTNIASIGKPAPHCTLQIVDDSGKEVPEGEIGELLLKGWVVMKEYFKDPEETARVKKGGWLYTGDLARKDKDGFYYIVGRKKEMIKVGGQIVYAPEVEAALYKNKDIAEVAVIGVPDAMKGEAVKAYVVVRPGSALKEEDVRYFAREHLANFKVPQHVEVRTSLPKNRTGKIDKALLKEESLVKG